MESACRGQGVKARPGVEGAKPGAVPAVSKKSSRSVQHTPVTAEVWVSSVRSRRPECRSKTYTLPSSPPSTARRLSAARHSERACGQGKRRRWLMSLHPRLGACSVWQPQHRLAQSQERTYLGAVAAQRVDLGTRGR